LKISLSDEILKVSQVDTLGAANFEAFREAVQAALPSSSLQAIEIDLSQAQRVDSYGLGALIAVHKCAANHNGNGAVPVRLLNPPQPVQQLLELTCLHRTFEIVKRSQ